MAALSLWLSACVVPVGPQFEDPPGNASPFLASSTPAAGSVLSASAPTIEVTLGDPNLDDILEGRWLIDYPPCGSISRLALEFRRPATGTLTREPVRFVPSCSEHLIASGLESHRVTLSVADRAFIPQAQAAPDLCLDSVQAEGLLVRATWILNLVCP
jgi:hypothetical protein